MHKPPSPPMMSPPGGGSAGRVVQGRFHGGGPRMAVSGVVQPRAAGHAQQLPNHAIPRGVGGRPLPDGIRQTMEAFFKSDFSDVRVYVGPEAPAVGALAFTMGSNLYFAPGQYNPESPQGRQILGHELTHVVQQRSGRVRNPFGGGIAVVQDPVLEAEAERMGAQAALRAMQPHPPAVASRAATGLRQQRTVAPDPRPSPSGRSGDRSNSPAPLQMRPTAPHTAGVIQRLIENREGHAPDVDDENMINNFFDYYDAAVTAAYDFVTLYPRLGPYATLDGHTNDWVTKWEAIIQGNSVAGASNLHMAFGYVIESLVSLRTSHLCPEARIPAGYKVVTQVSKDFTRPDLVLMKEDGMNYTQLAWADITAGGSAGHIFNKDGWRKHIAVFAELTYPSLTDQTIFAMKQNDGNVYTGAGIGLNPSAIRRKMRKVKLNHSRNVKIWSKYGEKFAPSELLKGNKSGINRQVAALKPQIIHEYVKGELEKHFRNEGKLEDGGTISMDLVPSVLAAMKVNYSAYRFDQKINKILGQMVLTNMEGKQLKTK